MFFDARHTMVELSPFGVQRKTSHQRAPYGNSTMPSHTSTPRVAHHSWTFKVNDSGWVVILKMQVCLLSPTLSVNSEARHPRTLTDSEILESSIIESSDGMRIDNVFKSKPWVNIPYYCELGKMLVTGTGIVVIRQKWVVSNQVQVHVKMRR